MSRDLYVLGINAWDHDVSACLLRNGEIVVAIEKERVSRAKHASGFFDSTIEYCLEAAGISLDEVDLIVRNSYLLPVPELERKLRSRSRPYHMTEAERKRAYESPLYLPQDERFLTCSHHLAHAYSAFAASPFDEGAVMVVDGVGGYRRDVTESLPDEDADTHPCARESESYYVFRGSELTCVKKVWMGPVPGLVNDDFTELPGLGAVYSRVSEYVFGDWNKCGEVMGLAPYGRPVLDPLMSVEDGELRVHEWPDACCHPWAGGEDARWEASEHREEYQDLAWRVQADSEAVLLARARWLHETTGMKNLCIAGGVALNCVANGVVVRDGPFENVWIQPAAGDNGIAIGCALYGHLAVKGNRRSFQMRSPYLGRTYDRFDEDEAFRPFHVKATTRRKHHSDIATATAERLSDGDIVGWFQGASEFGPRALGNRSILADPRDAAVKDRVNARVKFRQAFRPFAPAVLAERATEYFEGEAESPYMLLAKRVREEVADQIPGITHVDGTARVQTVAQADNPRFHALITAFAERTGVPVLLNTSFNVRGEPIVEVPFDAMECFLTTDIDVLVIHDWLVEKGALYRPLRRVVHAMGAATRQLRREALLERYKKRVLLGEE
ncbi:MAG: carbamoyltransferase family protein [Planctomycetota bacterium]|jgi:carbamoyltransferase